jgi:hypothetical protein
LLGPVTGERLAAPVNFGMAFGAYQFKVGRVISAAVLDLNDVVNL